MSSFDRKTAPPPAEPRPYHFPNITRATLPNGLRVLVAENHNAPLVSMRALVRSGADHDTAHTAGLASITADLLDEGAGSRDAIALAEDVGTLGGALVTGADWDASYIALDVLERTSEDALAIFGDIAVRPMLPEDGLERVRAERLNEILQQRNEPGAIAAKRFSNLLYGSGAYGNSVIGNAETVSNISIEDVRRFYAQHYIPNNSAVVIAGDIAPARAIELVTRALGEWERGAEPPRPTPVPKAIEASRIYVVDRPQAVQSEIRVGHLGVSRDCADYFPLSVMNSILGGIFNSRLNLNLRERHGYTYGVRSQFAFRRNAGPFVVAAPVRNEVTRESVTEMLGELRRIREGDIEDRELDETKSYLIGVFPASVQTASDVASRLVDMELYGLSEDYFDRYRENIAAVTKEDVERVAHKYLDPDRVLIVVVGNASEIREPLGGLGMPVHEMDIDGNLLAVG
ncbi:MAG TPA: pitrilysin family protein [Thermoanaerobaculia bacterium]|nr:pitrilysin family protein [Thermoanaerobaculia bacterium]